MSCYCYIVECSDGTYYTGWTTDPERRVSQHNKGVGAKYTSTRRPVKLVYLESQPNRTEAMKRELAIKRMKRDQKGRLIETGKINSKQ
ncbi:GIY-YIG nuclease family protein [Candidatus Villigracilis affinis]|uniref:GIY-YIG nuclease family protein n=1 Tax=Candidatus Villigracilis affinis TaxID=3140682 RepID=UPI001DE967E3|nr:GIY-YIG nuclease family protein [Anaerolineales bacterium]